MKKFILFLLIIGLGFVLWATYSDTDKKTDDAYVVYENSAGAYSLKLPAGWGVMDKDWDGTPVSSFYTTPLEEPKDDISEIDIEETPLISVITFTPADTSVLGERYEVFSADFEIVSDVEKSVDVVEVRKGDPNDCEGLGYSILTKTRIYTAVACYPDASYDTEMEQHLNTIVASLKENR